MDRREHPDRYAASNRAFGPSSATRTASALAKHFVLAFHMSEVARADRVKGAHAGSATGCVRKGYPANTV
jgi:hypothetical protein